MTRHQATLPARASQVTTSPATLRRATRKVRRLGIQLAFVRKPQVELSLTPDMLG